MRGPGEPGPQRHGLEKRKKMARKSSIHVRPVTSGSEIHNRRQKELSYVRSDLSHLNSGFSLEEIKDARRAAEQRYQASTGQKMQAKANPIREGVLLIDAHHTADDLKRLGQAIEQRFGIRTIQAYCHKDEGHYDVVTKEWKPNYHAHMVFDWTDRQTGKSARLSRNDLSELQDIVAREMNLERGQKSSKKHIESTQFKALKQEADLKKLNGIQNSLSEAFKIIKQSDVLEKEVDALRSQKSGLEMDNEILRSNKNFLEMKNTEIKTQLQQEERKLEEIKQQNRGFKR